MTVGNFSLYATLATEPQDLLMIQSVAADLVYGEPLVPFGNSN